MLFRASRIYDGQNLLSKHELLVENGSIVSIRPQSNAVASEVVDLGDTIIAPGFVDLQVNGAAGVMLNDRQDLDTIASMCRTHMEVGTTALLPTLISAPSDVVSAALRAGIEATQRKVPGFAGLHIEGPHIDPRRKGAHDIAVIRSMTESDVNMLAEAAPHLPTLLVTVAPESVTPAQIAELTKAGIVVSLGHSNTGIDAAKAAFRAGATMVTHLFNAMSQIGNREPGLVGGALTDGQVFAGLIADGIHVHPDNVALASRALVGRHGGIVLVTDAMACYGTDAMTFAIGGRTVVRANGALRLEDGTLAGADLDLPTALANFTRMAQLDIADSLAATTSTPARAIRRFPELGSLSTGQPANFVCLSSDLKLVRTWHQGSPVGR